MKTRRNFSYSAALSLGFSLLGALFTGLVNPALAQSCTKQSPAHRVALLELYTSEGCSSCPPADKFVSGLRASGVNADQAVLLSMHVDYWNYIGWKDVFSKPVITERQRWLTNLAGSKVIYTPEIFMAGQELRGGVSGWRKGVPDAVKRINNQTAEANINISLGQLKGGNLAVEVNGTAQQKGKLFVALVENNLVTDIKAGENSGVILKHDFVVREWLGPVTLSGNANDNKATFSRSIPVPANANLKNINVSAFIQNEKGEVLQALSLPLCNT
jgi:hypothetical protein